MWAVLSGVLSKAEGAEVLKALLKEKDVIKTVTPYAMHYFTEAMLSVGMKEEATNNIRDYWGAMVKQNADTFWEVFVPEKPEASPYGDVRMNSFCHAWSCTPVYFIRKYKL